MSTEKKAQVLQLEPPQELIFKGGASDLIVCWTGNDFGISVRFIFYVCESVAIHNITHSIINNKTTCIDFVCI